MNSMRETQGISNESKLRLAVAYVLAGQRESGVTLLAKSSIGEEPAKLLLLLLRFDRKELRDDFRNFGIAGSKATRFCDGQQAC